MVLFHGVGRQRIQVQSQTSISPPGREFSAGNSFKNTMKKELCQSSGLPESTEKRRTAIKNLDKMNN
jgi:hypothetical protein